MFFISLMIKLEWQLVWPLLKLLLSGCHGYLFVPSLRAKGSQLIMMNWISQQADGLHKMLCFFGSKISCLSLEISVGGCWSFWGNIPWHKPYVKIYTDYWNVKVWNRVRFFAFWNRGQIGYVTLSFHFQRQQFIPEVVGGKITRRGLKIQKWFPLNMLDNNIL